jgi:vacuolar-type H+-ATPase subunit E/Vma4
MPTILTLALAQRLHVSKVVLTVWRELCSEYSKTLNEARLRVLAAREEAIKAVITEARTKIKEVSKNPAQYKKLMQDLIVQVRGRVRFLC